jgi:hypothetical protein
VGLPETFFARTFCLAAFGRNPAYRAKDPLRARVLVKVVTIAANFHCSLGQRFYGHTHKKPVKTP